MSFYTKYCCYNDPPWSHLFIASTRLLRGTIHTGIPLTVLAISIPIRSNIDQVDSNGICRVSNKKVQLAISTVAAPTSRRLKNRVPAPLSKATTDQGAGFASGQHRKEPSAQPVAADFYDLLPELRYASIPLLSRKDA